MSGDTRTVAEIIGWTPEGTWFVDEPDGTAEVPVWVKPNGLRSVVEPSVDDLLAWLREAGYDVKIRANRTHMDGHPLLGGRYVGIDINAFGQPVIKLDGRTLHEGLSAAVRGVAGSTNQEPDNG